MAFDSTSGGANARRSSQPNLPLAPRPTPTVWKALRDEGVKWEGQILLVGSGMDVPALLVLTSNRFLVFSNGEPALELPRGWLRPEPKLLDNDRVLISMTPLGGSDRGSDTDRLTLRIRSGRGDAARLVSAITGRMISPREDQRVTRSDAPGAWSQSVGAATAMALPPLPDFDDDPNVARATRQWPPVELNPAPESSSRPAAAASSSISSWVARNLDEEEQPTPASHRKWPAETAPQPESHRAFHRGAVWGLRSLILAVLVGAALYFSYDRLPDNVTFRLPAPIEERFGLNMEETPADVSQAQATGQQPTGTGPEGDQSAATESTSDGTNGPANPELLPESATTAVGGNNGDITPVEPGIGTYAAPTMESASEPVTEEAAAPGPTDAPVQLVPTEEPVIEPTIEPTVAPPTGIPVTEEPATAPDTEVPATGIAATEEPTEAPDTEAPATEEPADAPVTEAATQEPADASATQAPATEELADTPDPETPATEVPPTVEQVTAEPTLESQPPSVDPGSTPEQQVADGGFRYTLTGLSRGESIPELPELAPVQTGEWIILTMDGRNWSGAEQVFDMSQFQLYADGQQVLLDVGNAWVGGLLGQVPAYGNTDAILWAPQEGHEFTLTFLAPRETDSLVLVAGDQVIDLSGSGSSAEAPIGPSQGDSEPASYIEADVVGVVDVETIVVEIDGIRQTVRYLGLDVPTGDDCFATEATGINRELVEGQTVRLERQATDVDARGNWVRDVWIPTDDGAYALAAESLVARGAATTGISEPNTRFASWLMGAQKVAQAEGQGLWGSCEANLGGETDTESVAPASLASQIDTPTGMRQQ